MNDCRPISATQQWKPTVSSVKISGCLPSIPAPSRASVPVTAHPWKIRSCALLIRRGIRLCWSSKGWIRRRYTPRDWATACRRSFRKRSFTVFPALNRRRSCGRPMPSSMISSNPHNSVRLLKQKRYQVYIWQAKSMGPPVMKKPPHKGSGRELMLPLLFKEDRRLSSIVPMPIWAS